MVSFEEAYRVFVNSSEEELRRIVEEKATMFIEQLRDTAVRHLAWELVEKNVQRVLKEKEEFSPGEDVSVGTLSIIVREFTTVQEYLLGSIDGRLKECSRSG